jgi:hypothetical protein
MRRVCHINKIKILSRHRNFFLSGSVILIFLSLPGWSRDDVDTTGVNYDSIQDQRMDRMEWRNGHRFRIIGEEQEKQQGKLDTIGSAVGDIEIQLEELERESLIQKERMEFLEKELDKASRSSGEYRRKLNHFLWVSGTVILLLVGMTFLILLLYGMKTRQLLERAKKDQKQVKNELSEEISNQEAIFMAALSARDQKANEELKLMGRDLRRRMKTEKKAAEKNTRKRIKKAIRKLGAGKTKPS